MREPQAQMSGSIKVNFGISTAAFEFTWATNHHTKELGKSEELE